MKKILIIVLVLALIVLVSCEERNPKLRFDDSTALNFSVAPTERFCQDIGMEHKPGNIFQQFSCIDDNGELHAYSMDNNGTHWILGNKSYLMEWSADK